MQFLFLQKAKRKIRELQYNFDSDGYQAPDLNYYYWNERNGIQQEPGGIKMMDGCLTYQRSRIATRQYYLVCQEMMEF